MSIKRILAATISVILLITIHSLYLAGKRIEEQNEKIKELKYILKCEKR